MTPSTPACTCQDQHRRGYCTEPGCPYSPTPTDAGALAGAEAAFEFIRLKLINHVEDGPERLAFWRAVMARDAIRLARNSAPQETRGDFDAVIDSVSNATAIIEQETRGDELRAALEPFAKAAPCAEITDLRDGDVVWRDRNLAGGYSVLTKDDFRRAAKAFAAAPQQLPRLEREGIKRKLIEMGFTSRDGTVINGGTFGVIDAILALLSPDTAVIPSTSHLEGCPSGDFGPCDCQVAPSNHPREVSK